MSSDSTYNIRRFPEPIHVDPAIIQAPPSPPSTVKKVASLSPECSPQDEEYWERPRKCYFGALLPFKVTRRIRVRVLYVFAALLGLVCWWKRGRMQDIDYLKQRASYLTEDFLLSPALEGLHFIPASNRNIRVSSLLTLQTITA